MKRLQLSEGNISERHSFPNDVAAAINQLDVATVTPAADGDWTVSHVRKVGVVCVGDYQIEVLPKMPVSSLFFMMGYSLDRNFWRDQDVTVGSDMELLSAMASIFVRYSARATEQGLLQGYESFEASLPIVRGRMNIPAQIGRRGGLAFPAEVIFDDFTIDIAENRILLSAAHRLLSFPTLTLEARTGLRKITRVLDGVSVLPRGILPPRIQFTRLNARYRTVVILAEMILTGSSIEHKSGDVSATAFLFDMWMIFEDFVTKALACNLEEWGGHAVMQGGGSFLDTGSELALRPDLVWQASANPLAVVDAKYKSLKVAGYPNPDIYQMLAYCIRFGLDVGHLVYAKGEEQARVYAMIGHPVAIHCHALDLDQQPSELLDQMRRLAQQIAGIN